MSQHDYKRTLTAGVWDTQVSKLSKEVEAALPGKVFTVAANATALSFFFDDTLTAGEITTLTTAVTDHQAASPDPPLPSIDQIAQLNVLTSTTSSSPVDLNGMTLTVGPTRKYLCIFECSFANAKRQITTFELVIDNVVKQTRRKYGSGVNHNVVSNPSQASLSFLSEELDSGTVVKVRYYGSGGNIEVQERSLIIQGIP